MDGFAAAAARMDAAVDERLGDSILYTPAGEAEIPLKAFIIFPNQGDEGSGEAYDELGAQRPRLKVAKASVDRPRMADRIRGGDDDTRGKLQNTRWQPTSAKPQVAGRYWIFDMQKVGG